MISVTVLLWVIGHFIADFYFQTNTLAEEKNHSLKALLQHCTIYMITMIIVSVPVMNATILFYTLIISLIHLIVDSFKFLWTQSKEFSVFKDIVWYIGDQLVHIFTILIIAAFMKLSTFTSHYIGRLDLVVDRLSLNVETFLAWLLIIIILMQPSSITIRKILNYFEPNTDEYSDEGISHAGALIGIFERFIILLMLAANQFTAIGFVLTAKSIARYNKISENPQFAEYYLLGTLLSSLLVILSYMIIF